MSAVVGDLKTRVWPSSAETQRSVNVPPTSVPMKNPNAFSLRSAFAAVPDCSCPIARKAAGAVPASRRARSLDSVAELPQAIAGFMPRFIQPELATLVKTIPPGDGWLHEMKYDGYRMLCKLDRAKAELYTRNRNLWTAKLPELAARLASLPAR